MGTIGIYGGALFATERIGYTNLCLDNDFNRLPDLASTRDLNSKIVLKI